MKYMKKRNVSMTSSLRSIPCILGFFLFLAAFFSVEAKAKQAVDLRIALAFPDQGKPVAQELTIGCKPEFAKPWDTVIVTNRAETAGDSPVPSSGDNVATGEKQVISRPELAKAAGTLVLPVTVTTNGEYLIIIELEFRQGEDRTGKGKIVTGLLVEEGKVWFGRGSIEMAFVEKTKVTLHITGEPEGAGLAELNQRWAAWLQVREKTLRQRDAGREATPAK